MSVDRTIAVANQHRRLRIDRRALAAAILTLDAAGQQFRQGCPAGELSLVFVTDRALAQLHGDFLQDPSETDVITFEGAASFRTAGEICVSADAAWRHVTGEKGVNGSRSSKTAVAVAQELLLYVVHGWLHLAGYDDLVPAKKRLMRRAEARAMKLLAKNGAAAPFRFIK